MNFKLMVLMLSALLLSACLDAYDYSGRYETTKGDFCDIRYTGHALMIISPASEDGKIYTAWLNAEMSENGMLPAESEPSKVSWNGSLVFKFVSKGTLNWRLRKPTVEMEIEVVKKDDQHLYIKNWPVTFINPNTSEVIASFDFVKDREVVIMGKHVPNEIYQQAGERGLCLKQNDIWD